jgi:hypothetical protein
VGPMKKLSAFAIGLAFAGLTTAADAQLNPTINNPESLGTRYDVQDINFDMWCQEQQHLPAARCDKRLPEDDDAFNTYRAKIERFEIPYLQQQQRQLRLNSGILHNDPVDHPDQPSQPQNQPPTGPVPPR